MNLEDKHERVPVPKWRALTSTPSTELVSARNVQPDQELAIARADRMHALYARWQEIPKIDNALELLDCSSFIYKQDLFYDAAAQIINSSEVTKTSKFVAQQVIHPEHASSTTSFNFDPKYIHRAIADNKARLRDQTRNGLLHAEQARLYAVVDEAEAAEHSFTKALAVAPDNRHILRSFARFMVHIEQPEVALRKLRKSSAICSDPWVQAAEIAISEYHSVGSLIARSASRVLDASQIAYEHASELATALATLERRSGHSKRFKKRLRESLAHPSENAIAQATWLFREVPSDIPEDILKQDLPIFNQSAEARTYALLKKRKWNDAVKSFVNWQNEESFSKHIAIEGSFYAISFAMDYDLAISICENGLIANSNSHGLMNNLCYAKRRRGFIDDAVDKMKKLKSVYRAWKNSPTYLATEGMLKFALGNHDLGRSTYIKALNVAQDSNNDILCQRIKMHWLQEEVISGALTKSQVNRLIEIIQKNFNVSSRPEERTDYWKNIKEQIETASAEVRERQSDQPPKSHFIENYL